MKTLTLLLLLTVFASPAVRGQSHTPGDGGPDPANIASRTAPVAAPAGVPMLPFHFGARPAANRRAVAPNPPVVQVSDPRIMKIDKTGRFLTSASLERD